MAKLSSFQLRQKSTEDLETQLRELKQDLANLRVQKVAGTGGSRVAKIGTVRKDIARVLTAINYVQRSKVREAYKGKKYIPIDLRAKKTRAIRRRLSPHQAKARTIKEKKKLVAFPQRKFALKA